MRQSAEPPEVKGTANGALGGAAGGTIIGVEAEASETAAATRFLMGFQPWLRTVASKSPASSKPALKMLKAESNDLSVTKYLNMARAQA